jgi:hypothetical protein
MFAKCLAKKEFIIINFNMKKFGFKKKTNNVSLHLLHMNFKKRKLMRMKYQPNQGIIIIFYFICKGGSMLN